MSNATQIQQLPPGWHDDRGPELIAINVACIVAIVLFVSLRIYAQSFAVNPWKAIDTWFTIIASIFSIGVAACILYSIKLGLGKHTIRVVMEDPAPPRRLANIFMYAYVQTILQAAGIMSIKLAILTLYVRAFGLRSHDRFFVYGIYACFTFTILLGVGSILEFILQCIPAPVFWNRIYLLFPGGVSPDGPTEGYCMDQLTHVVVPVALDLVNEVAIMILPAKILWNLRLPLRKKLGLGVTFGLGLFVCVTNIVRLWIYSKMVNGGDIAWDDIDAFIWTIVQLTIAVVCACIPPSAPLLKIWRGSRQGSTGAYGSSNPLSAASNPNNQSGRWTKTFKVSYSEERDGLSMRALNESSKNLDTNSRASPV